MAPLSPGDRALVRLMNRASTDGRYVDADVVASMEARCCLVGEAPGPRGSPETPLHPYPPLMAGGRLLALADVHPELWLGRVLRTNLLPEYPGPGSWSAAQRTYAATEARRLLTVATVDGVPRKFALLGRQVATAFGCPGVPFQWYMLRAEAHAADGVYDGSEPPRWEEWRFDRRPAGRVVAVALPHPSGRNRVLNSNGARARMRLALREAIR